MILNNLKSYLADYFLISFTTQIFHILPDHEYIFELFINSLYGFDSFELPYIHTITLTVKWSPGVALANIKTDF